MRIVVAGVAAAFLAACTTTRTPASVDNGLIGTWRLLSFEDRTAGAITHPYGEKPVGLLIYDATGHMAIQIMKTPHPKVASGSDGDITPEEKVALFDAYTAYFGTYRVDAARSVVITRAEADTADVFIGQDEERPFRLTGDRLTLMPEWDDDGKHWTGIREFERVRSSSGR